MTETYDLILLSDPEKGVVAKASSVLQKNSMLYGPMNGLDYKNPSSSWNSEGSSSGKQSSSYIIDFGGRVVVPVELRLQFQAGFGAEEIAVFWQNSASSAWEPLIELEVNDDHDLQCFSLKDDDKKSIEAPPKTTAVKLVFSECTDFYGRLIIYHVQIWGREGPMEPSENDTT